MGLVFKPLKNLAVRALSDWKHLVVTSYSKHDKALLLVFWILRNMMFDEYKIVGVYIWWMELFSSRILHFKTQLCSCKKHHSRAPGWESNLRPCQYVIQNSKPSTQWNTALDSQDLGFATAPGWVLKCKTSYTQKFSLPYINLISCDHKWKIFVKNACESFVRSYDYKIKDLSTLGRLPM